MTQQCNFTNLVVGERSDTISLQSLDDFCQAFDAIAQQAKRHLKLFTQELDHDLYDRPEFVDAVVLSLKRKKDQQLCILLKDPNKASKLGHRLVELQKRLPSKVEIRGLPDEYQDLNDEYLIVDDIAMVKRFAVGHMRGHCEFRSIPDALKYGRQFDEIWQRSTPCRELGRIHL